MGSTTRWLVAFELRSLLRDRRTLLLSIVLPLLLLPALVLGQQAIERRRDEHARAATYHYAIEAASEHDTREVEDWLALGLLHTAESERPHLQKGSWDEADVRIVLVRTPAPARLELRFEADREDSRQAMASVAAVLRTARIQRTHALVRDVGHVVPSQGLVPWTVEDLAPPSVHAATRVAPFATLVLVVMLMLGGQVAACDIVAGERERGTLETLLTTAARRSEIILAKLTTVTVVALATTTIHLVNFAVGASLGLLPGPALPTLGALRFFLLALLYLPLAGLVSAILVLVTARARTYKEAQLYTSALLLVLLVPAAASLHPGLELDSILVLLPIANVSLAVTDVLAGHVRGGLIATVVATNLLVTYGLCRWAGTSLDDEDRLFAPSDGFNVRGPRGLQRELPVFVATLWMAILIGSNFWPNADVRLQLTFNLLVVLLGAPLWLVRRHGLDLREVWALRPTSPWSYVVVLLVGVPSGLVAALGMGDLAAPYLPVPEHALRALEQALTQSDLSLAQQLVWMALLPGIVEELFFRGVLMYGLAPRLRPVWRCLAIALLFGLFHVALFRLVPTAFLGALLGGARLLSGAIGPAIIWHILHNAVGILAMSHWGSEAALPAWAYPASAAGLVVTFAVLRLLARRRVAT